MPMQVLAIPTSSLTYGFYIQLLLLDHVWWLYAYTVYIPKWIAATILQEKPWYYIFGVEKAWLPVDFPLNLSIE